MPASASESPILSPGLEINESSAITNDWSIKKDIFGKDISIDNHATIGAIEYLLVTRHKAISCASIGVGGLPGMGGHDGAIPVSNPRVNKTQITLPRATAEDLKALPVFRAITENWPWSNQSRLIDTTTHASIEYHATPSCAGLTESSSTNVSWSELFRIPCRN